MRLVCKLTQLIHWGLFSIFVLFQHYGPEIKWVEGGKPLLKVSAHLVSTVYTQVCAGHRIPEIAR